MFEEAQFQRAIAAIGGSYSPELYSALATAYQHRDRHYHSQQHISDCLRTFALLAGLAERPAEIEIAIWFHDAVYNTHRQDNEERSAEWAREALTKLGVAPAAIARIANSILATKTHEPDTPDCALMVDVDLSILGAPWSVFETYDAAIRQEYAWVPEPDYRKGRASVLNRFLERPQIYQTSTMHSTLEQAARSNLARKIRELSD